MVSFLRKKSISDDSIEQKIDEWLNKEGIYMESPEFYFQKSTKSKSFQNFGTTKHLSFSAELIKKKRNIKKI